MSRRVAAGLVVVVSASLLVGCGHPKKDPGPPVTAAGSTTAPAPVVDTTEPPDPRQANIDAASAAYRNYVAVRDAVRQDHFRDWDTKLLPLTTMDEGQWVMSYFPQALDLGHYQTGNDVIENLHLAANGYMDSPTETGDERVVLEACMDSSGRQELGSKGQDTSVPGSHGRFVVTVAVQHLAMFDAQGVALQDPIGQSWWRVAKEDYDRDRPC